MVSNKWFRRRARVLWNAYVCWKCSRMKILCAVVFGFACFVVRAQVLNEVYQFPNEMPAAYKVDALGQTQTMAQEPYKKHKTKDIARFAEMTAYGKKHLMRSGAVYFNPPLAEPYLNELAALINAGNPPVKLYLARDASYNAYAIHDGSLFVHVGILAEMPNEAALAMILGHEISHYLNDDNRTGFFNKLDLFTKKNRNSNVELRIDKAHEDRTMEHIADSMGAILSRKAGFDLHWAEATFTLLLDPEPTNSADSTAAEDTTVVAKRKKGQRPAGSLAALLADHPDTRDRIVFLEQLQHNDSSLRGGAEYKVNETVFQKLRHMARLETLNLLLEGHEYQACIERAFRFHLLEPEENNYLYFLSEALRRFLYILPEKEHKGFLANIPGADFEKGLGVLDDPSLVIRDSVLLSTVDLAPFYTDDQPKFNTNKEALEYFLEAGDAAGVVEVLLSKAIYYRKDPNIKEDALVRYEANGGAAKEFARSMRVNHLDKDLKKNKGELLLLDEIDFVEDHTYGYHVRYVLAEEKEPRYRSALRSMVAKHFPMKTVVGISELREEDMNALLSYGHIADNMAMVQWMWDYENTRARMKERLRLEGRLRRKRTKEVEEKEVEVESAEADTLSTNEDMADQEDFDPEDWKRKKRTKKDVKFYYIDPLYWEFLAVKGYRTVEYLKVKSFDDKTRVAGNALGGVLFVYPAYWTSRIGNGSNRYSFSLNHVKFDTGTQEVRMNTPEVNYKMTRPHLKGAVFNSLVQMDQ